MSPKEELIQGIEHLPDAVIKALLELLKTLQFQQSKTGLPVEQKTVLERMGGEPQHMLSAGNLSDRDRRTWQLCGRFAVAENLNSAAHTNYAEDVDDVLYQGL
ncbi:MAG: hypothetical protein KME23_29135 [Goleter apudmare HA4340-LM2]|jgi:hypothetical protein|nr:hypothetical protein [Goleter apudmare HA4340-LM2]MBW4647004.1 hypothetical protein [Goleter apudmare HA4340-LM2]